MNKLAVSSPMAWLLGDGSSFVNVGDSFAILDSISMAPWATKMVDDSMVGRPQNIVDS